MTRSARIELGSRVLVACAGHTPCMVPFRVGFGLEAMVCDAST